MTSLQWNLIGNSLANREGGDPVRGLLLSFLIFRLLSENCFLTGANMYNDDRAKRPRLLGLVSLSWFVLHPIFDSQSIGLRFESGEWLQTISFLDFGFLFRSLQLVKTNRLLHGDQLVEFFLIDTHKGIGTLMDIGNGIRIPNVRGR